MTTALVIAGGGSRGAFAVGAIEVLLDRGYSFGVVAGTSTGALIAPLVAIGDIDKLVEIYTTVRTKDILRGNWRRLWLDGRYDTVPLERLIRDVMGTGAGGDTRYDRLMRSDTRVLLCTVCLQTGAKVYWSQKTTAQEIDEEGIRAWPGWNGYVEATLGSANQPVLMRPSWLGGQQYVDGGIREVAPMRVACRNGVTKVVVIANSPEKPEPDMRPQWRWPHIGVRSLDLMTTELLNDDIKREPSTPSVVIRPQQQLPSDGLDFDPATMQRMRAIGRESARVVLA